MVLTDQVDDHPAAVALLDVGHGERGDLRTAQPTAEECGQDGPAAHASARGEVGHIEQVLRLDLGQPVASARAGRGDALDFGHAGGEIGVEKAVVGRLAGQSPDGAQLLTRSSVAR